MLAGTAPWTQQPRRRPSLLLWVRIKPSTQEHVREYETLNLEQVAAQAR